MFNYVFVLNCSIIKNHCSCLVLVRCIVKIAERASSLQCDAVGFAYFNAADCGASASRASQRALHIQPKRDLSSYCLNLQTGVYIIREEGIGPLDSQYRADIECHPEQQVAGRSQAHL